jgi:hypothetical protein
VLTATSGARMAEPDTAAAAPAPNMYPPIQEKKMLEKLLTISFGKSNEYLDGIASGLNTFYLNNASTNNQYVTDQVKFNNAYFNSDTKPDYKNGFTFGFYYTAGANDGYSSSEPSINNSDSYNKGFNFGKKLYEYIHTPEPAPAPATANEW